MTARIQPDTRPVVYLTTGLVLFLGMVSFTVSFTGLSAVAEWAALPPHLRWTVPVFVDGALLAYTLAVLIHRARGESARFSWVALGVFTVVSVSANAAHVLGSAGVVDWRTWAGATIAALAPLGVFAATHTVAALAVTRPRTMVQVVHDEPPMVHAAIVTEPSERQVDQRGPAADHEEVTLVHAGPRTSLEDEARYLRASEGMTHRAIAEHLGVSKSKVTRWLAAA